MVVVAFLNLDMYATDLIMSVATRTTYTCTYDFVLKRIIFFSGAYPSSWIHISSQTHMNPLRQTHIFLLGQMDIILLERILSSLKAPLSSQAHISIA